MHPATTLAVVLLSTVLAAAPAVAAPAELTAADVDAAVEATLATGTADFAAVIESTGAGADGTGLLAAFEGETNFGSRDTRMWTSMQTFEMEAPMTVIIEGSDVYLGGAAFEGIPQGAWLHGDLDDPSPLLEEMVDALAGGNDAPVVFYWLLGIDGPLEVRGQEAVAGVLATHVVAPVDLDLALSRTPAAGAEAFALNLERMREETADVESIEAWIDPEGMVRRVAWEYVMPSAAAEAGTLGVRFEFSEFGEPWSPPIPDALDVIEFDDFLGGAGG